MFGGDSRGMSAYGSADQPKDKYKMYQKEAQIISVTGTDSSVYFSIPQLKANFININMNEPQDMSYQIKSFRFNNTFNNIKATDKIRVNISCQWQLGNPQTGQDMFALPNNHMYVTNETIGIFLGASATQEGIHNAPIGFADRCMQAYEVVAVLNQQILQFAVDAIQTISSNANPQIFASGLNSIYFSQGFQFGVSDAGKLGIFGDTQHTIFPIMDYNQNDIIGPPANFLNNGISPPDWHLTGIEINLYTDETATLNDQRRIATYFNMVPIRANAQVSEFNNVNLLVLPKYYCELQLLENSPNGAGLGLENDLFNAVNYTFLTAAHAGNSTNYWKKYMYQLNIASLGLNEPAPVVPGPGGGGVLNQINFNETAGGRLTMRTAAAWQDQPIEVIRYTDIYIRTSLNTNHWDYTGKKSDVMEVIPVVQGMNDIGKELRNITRIYQSKDPSINTFTVRFTDAEGELIKFNSPYTLTLAVFFTPT